MISQCPPCLCGLTLFSKENKRAVMGKIIRFIDIFSAFGGILSAVMICLGVGLIIVEIIMRSVFNSTLYITEEYSGYLMSMLTFVALGYTMREKGHIRMTFLRSVLSPKGRVVLDMICFTVGAIFCAGLTYVTGMFFWDSYATGSRSMQISSTPLAIPQLFLPLGALMITLQCVAECLKGYQALQSGAYSDIKEEAKDLGH